MMTVSLHISTSSHFANMFRENVHILPTCFVWRRENRLAAEFPHGNHALRPESAVKPCVSQDNMFIRSNLSGKMVLFTEKV